MKGVNGIGHIEQKRKLTDALTLNMYSLMKNKSLEYLSSKLPTGDFARNVVTLMTGTTFAQALIILASPILTRLYGPGDYGIAALYTSILAILTVVACWCYQFAIVLPENDEDAANLLALSVLICFGMAALTLVLAALFRIPIAKLLSAPKLAPWLWLMPLSLLEAGLFQTLNYWSTRRKQFARLAARTITQSAVSVSTQVVAGFALHPGMGGLISGTIIGTLTATGQLAMQIFRDEGNILKSYINRADIKRMSIRYREFPIYSSWGVLLNSASYMLPVLLMGYFFSPAVVGYYALGNSVMSMPMNVVGGSIAQVFFPRATEARRSGTLDHLTLEMFQRLLSIGFVPILLITIVAPNLFAIIFGARWLIAGEYVRWISLLLLFAFISSPLSGVYNVMERQRDFLIFNVVLFSTRILVIIIGGIEGNALFTIALFGITGAILYIFLCIYILHLAAVPMWKTLTAIMNQLIQGVPYALLPVLVWYGSKNSLAFVLAGIAAGLIFLLVKAYRLKKESIDVIANP
jgi:O-antigen/teichoic acid export membrane protein